MDGVRLGIDAGRARRVLLALVVVFDLASMASAVWIAVLHQGGLYGVIDLLDVDSERSVSTVFQTVLLLACAALLWLVARTDPPERARWLVLAGVFTFLAVDEDTSIHEILIIPLNRALDRDRPLVSLWLIPMLAVVVVLAVALLPWWRSLATRDRRRFGVAAACYLAGAVVMETVNGWYGDRHGFINVPYRMFLVTIEETLEAVGIVLFLSALLSLLGELATPIRIDVAERGGA